PFLAPGETACTSGLTLSRSGHDSYQLLQAFEAVQVFEFSDAGDTAPLRRLRLGGAQIELSYDVTGRLIEIVDSLGRPIVLDWIPGGRIRRLLLRDESNPKDWRFLLQYDYDPAGNLVAGVDRFRTTFSFEWDEFNRMIRRTDRRGYSFHFAYDAQGRCI